MKWVKRIGIALGSIVVLLIGLVVGSALWLGSGAIDIPDLGVPTQNASATHNDSFAPAIAAAQERLIDTRARIAAPGVSIAVSLYGELIWQEAHGYADIETRAPLTLDSRFIIGSVSKPVTAAAAVALAERDLLDLDADIHTYLPDYPELPYTLTTRQLLSHQGGIRHYDFAMNPPIFSESGMNQPFASTTDALAIFSGDELLFEPDTSFQYSTFGYTLVSAVLEAASGQNFLDLLDELVFVPAGMTNTSADYQDRAVPNRVSDYVTLQFVDGVLPAPETDPSYKWAGGGLASTPTDLVRFGNGLLDGTLVSAESLEMMFTPRETTDGEINPQHYGLGWRAGGLYYPQDSENIIPMINHGGTSIGGTAILLLYPDSGLVVAMTANVTPPGGSGPLRSEAAAISRMFLDHIGFVPGAE